MLYKLSVALAIEDLSVSFAILYFFFCQITKPITTIKVIEIRAIIFLEEEVSVFGIFIISINSNNVLQMIKQRINLKYPKSRSK
jgi:hypothetical protein